MLDRQVGPNAEVVMPVSDLHGRAVWSESGKRIGTIRGINTDDDGRIVSFDVRERWLLGPHHEVPATGMRLDDGDVVVPGSAVESMRSREHDREDREDRHERRDDAIATPARSTSPVFLAGRDGVRGRFGGLDLIGSFFGGLVIIASTLIIGSILAAAFGSDPAVVDTAMDSPAAFGEEAMLVGGLTLLLACFMGGWCAGRSARYDGVGNAVMSVVWTLAIVLGLGALAAWLGEEYNVLAGTELPTFTNDEFALWGLVALGVTLAIMLVGAILGGLLGESWHKRADRAMLDVVPMDTGTDAHTRSTTRTVDDSDAVVVDDDGSNRRVD